MKAQPIRPGLSLGIFGGTFDPVHRGHLALARAALKHLPLDRVLFMPAARSVFKASAPVAPALHRFAMLALAIQADERLGLLTLELEGAGVPRYTVDSLAAIQRRFRPRRMWLLMGLDNWAGFTRWRRPRAIAARARLGVAGRPGSPRAAAPDWLRRRTDFFPLRQNISGTEIRASLRRGAAAGKSAAAMRRGLPGAVRRYLEKNPLYS
jgi:nicotinate-nucleotide adenylyltransferase